MVSKFNALIHNGTSTLVSPKSHMNVVGSKWVYRIKCNAKGFIEHHKAWLDYINNTVLTMERLLA